MLSFGTFFVLKEAIVGILNPEPVIVQGTIFMAIIGILINGISVFRMKGTKKLLDKTVVMHLLEDFLGWIAVLIVSVVMLFADWFILDPILSIIISLIVIRTIIINIKHVTLLLMCATPNLNLSKELKKLIRENRNVDTIQKFNIWTLDGDEHVFTATIIVKQESDKSETLKEIKDILEEKEIHQSTIELIVKNEAIE